MKKSEIYELCVNVKDKLEIIKKDISLNLPETLLKTLLLSAESISTSLPLRVEALVAERIDSNDDSLDVFLSESQKLLNECITAYDNMLRKTDIDVYEYEGLYRNLIFTEQKFRVYNKFLEDKTKCPEEAKTQTDKKHSGRPATKWSDICKDEALTLKLHDFTKNLKGKDFAEVFCVVVHHFKSMKKPPYNAVLQEFGEHGCNKSLFNKTFRDSFSSDGKQFYISKRKVDSILKNLGIS